MTKSFAFFIFCWGDTPSIFILFQNLCDHFDCGLERCVLQISNITSQTNRNSHTYQEVLSEWSSDYSEHARSQHCDVSYYNDFEKKVNKQTTNPSPPAPRCLPNSGKVSCGFIHGVMAELWVCLSKDAGAAAAGLVGPLQTQTRGRRRRCPL